MKVSKQLKSLFNIHAWQIQTSCLYNMKTVTFFCCCVHAKLIDLIFFLLDKKTKHVVIFLTKLEVITSRVIIYNHRLPLKKRQLEISLFIFVEADSKKILWMFIDSWILIIFFPPPAVCNILKHAFTSTPSTKYTN